MVKSFFAHYDAQKRDVTRKTLACYMTAIREFAKSGLRKRYWAEDPVLDITPIRYIKGKPRPFAPDDLERLIASTPGTSTPGRRRPIASRARPTRCSSSPKSAWRAEGGGRPRPESRPAR